MAARAQQRPIPAIGYLTSNGEGAVEQNAAALFRRGIGEQGHIEGRDFKILYRYAKDQFDRLPDLAAELVRRPVAVIFADTTPASLAAKKATTTIPIVFAVGSDPIQAGLVASFNRPGGNVTGTVYLVV
jgi:putative ABC transport system substrate-binding protein